MFTHCTCCFKAEMAGTNWYLPSCMLTSLFHRIKLPVYGISETFMSKNKSKSLDARLAKMTKWIGLVFVVLTIVLNIL